jgi:hypothetical protein
VLRHGWALALNVLVDRPSDLGGEASIVRPSHHPELLADASVDNAWTCARSVVAFFSTTLKVPATATSSPAVAELGTAFWYLPTEFQVISARRTTLNSVAHTWGDLEVSAS